MVAVAVQLLLVLFLLPSALPVVGSVSETCVESYGQSWHLSGPSQGVFARGKAAYAAAVTGGYVSDALALIQRRYFKRFPVDLPLDQEPTPESLAGVDDEAADDELVPPNESNCTPEEYEALLGRFQERGKMVAMRKAQIKRWFAYQYMKDQNVDGKDSGAQSPYRVLLKRLSGVQDRRPKQNSGTNVWRRSCREEIEEEAKRRLVAKQDGNKKKDLASIREALMKEKFMALDDEEKVQWKDLAKQEHNEAIAKWEKEMKEPPKKDPVSRQHCIQALPQFVQPILDGICEATGWKCTLIAGGPEPAHNGRLNMIGVHSGTTKGDIKMNFGRAERLRWQSHIVEVFGDFLKKCYSPEDCRQRAVSQEEGFEPITALELDKQGINVNTIESQTVTRHATPVAAPTPNVVQTEPSPSNPTTTPSADRPSQLENGVSNSLEACTDPTAQTMTPQCEADSEPCEQAASVPAALTTAQNQVAGETDQPRNGDGDTSSAVQHSSPTADNATHPSFHDRSPLPSRHGSTPPEQGSSRAPSRAASLACFSPPRALSPPLDFTKPTPDNVASTSKLPPPVALSPSRSADEADGTLLPAPLSPSKRASEADDADAMHPPQKRRSRPQEVEAEVPAKRGRCESDAEQPPSDTGQASRELRSKRKRPVASATPHLTPAPSSSCPDNAADGRLADACDDELGRASKRSRKSGAPTKTNHIPSPPEASSSSPPPPWFTKSLGMFKSSSLGNEWDMLLRGWSDFEQLSSYEGGVLPSTHCPNVIAMWIGRRRSVTWKPNIRDVKNIETEFDAWWTSLQPEWRVVEGKVDTSQVEGDWQCLRFAGINGIQSVIAALFFWNTVLPKDDMDAPRRWKSAVKDVLQALTQLNSP